MKIYKLSFALLLGLGALASCNSNLDVTNPNQQTTETFGNTTTELEECVVAAYNHIRMEGSYARVGYNIDVMRGDEAWNCSQVWYMPFDDLNDPITDEIAQWSYRDWYYAINVTNFILKKCAEFTDQTSSTMKRIQGQAYFIRGLAYYNLVNYYQNPPLITDYDTYSDIEKQYVSNGSADDPNAQYDLVLDQVESDFVNALSLLPNKDTGGEWSKGRATSGAAAGYLARALMQRHKYDEALEYLQSIISGEYGTYKLMADFGDNFREGTAYENNDESLFEVQFLDKSSQGSDDEWTPVNTSKNATQGSAIESNFAPVANGGWGDIAITPWAYQLLTLEHTTDGDGKTNLDPRLYWTCGSYSTNWDSNPYITLGNVFYTKTMTFENRPFVNGTYAGMPFAKWTHLRTGEYSSVVTGLHDGINLRLMRYSDVLLRAAECINEIADNPTNRAQAISWINEVRTRAHLAELDPAKFEAKSNPQDYLFEWIVNYERPKEFAGEYGRGNDLIRWGFFYTDERLKQLKDHNSFKKNFSSDAERRASLETRVYYNNVTANSNTYKSSYDTYVAGHEFLPIYQGTLDANENLVGNSANNNLSNAAYFTTHYGAVHPVVTLPTSEAGIKLLFK